MNQLILEAITDILTLKKDFNIEHLEVETSKNLSGRMIDFGLANDSCVKIGDYSKHQKHLKKIHKKFGIPDSEHILFAVTDATLAGPYGLIITEQNVYSKDLMEKPQYTKRIAISGNYPATIVENSIRLENTIIHVLLSSVDSKESVKQIIGRASQQRNNTIIVIKENNKHVPPPKKKLDQKSNFWRSVFLWLNIVLSLN